MPLETAQAREYLRTFALGDLFNELGWDHHPGGTLHITVDSEPFELVPVAQKRGVQVYECCPGATGSIPPYNVRQKIERQVAKHAREHLLIFGDAARQNQVWQWVPPGKPRRCREERCNVLTQSGDAIIQKLNGIRIALSEEEAITLPLVTQRLRDSFDKERVTKTFYDRFQREQRAFVSFISGIHQQASREWYASLMLNRLMFVYFIQKKGFLDGDPDYLRARLVHMRQQGKGAFLTFYRYFLVRLFHQGLGQPAEQRAPEMESLLGRVPYLNGGLFEVHELEEQNPDIDIPDEAFERLFAFFDAYDWRLDDRPLATGSEINPDVLGYIFEKYVNQKQMGAYYTKEDITEYIARNTVVPHLLSAARRECAIAFRRDGEVWRLLRDDPDRYFFAAAKRGIDLPLPEHIATAFDGFSQRAGWNKPAPAELSLPAETWREVAARRRRYHELCGILANGEVTAVNDFVAYNLDIRQFAQDVIEQCGGPDLLRALFAAIRGVTVLDPTCGSGAFLFAALSVLEPLYEACLKRMQAFVDELELSDEQHSSKKFDDFRQILAEAARHSNQRYFILKSIIINNLFGVDIMEEAVEICKLRLFLKLVAQLERREDVEPLPDIDFNIRAGNTLVGFASMEAVNEALTFGREGQRRLLSDEDLAAIARVKEQAEICDMAFRQFRAQQTEQGMSSAAFTATKRDLRLRLAGLNLELDGWLAATYGVDAGTPDAFSHWRASHQPFQWLVEFYGIMAGGGFDVIIGNPPWREYAQVRSDYTVRGYATEACGNLHAMCTERGLSLLGKEGWMSFIVQLPLSTSERMAAARQLLRDRGGSLFISTFDDRPGKLFGELQHCRSAVFIAGPRTGGRPALHTTRYQRWPSEARETLFGQLVYAPLATEPLFPGHFPKYAHEIEARVFEKLVDAGGGAIGPSPAATPHTALHLLSRVGTVLDQGHTRSPLLRARWRCGCTSTRPLPGFRGREHGGKRLRGP